MEGGDGIGWLLNNHLEIVLALTASVIAGVGGPLIALGVFMRRVQELTDRVDKVESGKMDRQACESFHNLLDKRIGTLLDDIRELRDILLKPTIIDRREHD